MSCNRIGALALLILAVLWPMAASAQISGTMEPKSGEIIAIELNEGQLVRFDNPAASVFITNPNVADINVRSTRLVYLFGKTPGKTTLFALDSEDNVIANMEVVVQHNLTRLQGALEPTGSYTPRCRGCSAWRRRRRSRARTPRPGTPSRSAWRPPARTRRRRCRCARARPRAPPLRARVPAPS